MRIPAKAARLLCLGMITTILLVAAIPIQVRASPVTTLTVSDPKLGTDPTYVNAETEFTLSSVDSASQPVTNIWYRWVNATDAYPWTQYSGAFTALAEMTSPGGAPGLPIDLEGSWTLQYNATDSLGQNENIKTYNVFIDSTHPVTQIQYSGTVYTADSVYIESTTLISLTASDTGTGVAEIRYSINAGPESVYAGPFAASEAGQNDIRFYSVDLLGNTEPTNTAYTRVDDDAPLITIVPGTPQCTVGTTLYISGSTAVTLSASDVSGISEIKYRVDSGSWTVYSAPFTVASEGQHTLAVVATDMMGHASAESTLSLYRDSTAPAVTVPGASGGVLEAEYGSSFSFECSDAGAGNCNVYYSIDDGTTWTLSTGQLVALEDAVIRYYAEDGVGNMGSEATLNLWVAEQSGEFWTTELIIVWMSVCAGILVVIILTYRRLDRMEKEKGKGTEEKSEGKRKIKRQTKEDDVDQAPKQKMKRNR